MLSSEVTPKIVKTKKNVRMISMIIAPPTPPAFAIPLEPMLICQ
ncbi:hypothetical protein [Anaerosporobacter sp.]|nr:hypothetical protein [Anaerosporobacter sp.]